MRALNFILLIILSVVIASVYGVAHDHITFSISPEYFTLYKFPQFQLEGNLPTYFKVTLTGIIATWWVGLINGLILFIVGVKKKDNFGLLINTLKSFLICMGIAVIFGFIGYFVGHFIVAELPSSTINKWDLPRNLIDYKAFLTVGTIHNFSYLGGFMGLIGGILYQRKMLKKI